MKSRWLRFFPVVDLTQSIGKDNFRAAKTELGWKTTIPDPPLEFTWWDWTVFLLHTAAEVEHSLLVQYLYSGYSIGETLLKGSGAPDMVKHWRKNLLTVAKQEMAHLATVQNLKIYRGPIKF